MKKIIRVTLKILLIILIIIQFIRPDKNIAGSMMSDITNKYSVPINLMNTFQTACYNCHSNQSEYPWYWNIQPVAWFMSDHIEEGKSRLNFNEFASYTIRRQYKTIGEINDEVKSGGMPLTSYTLVHVDARLSDQQKHEIANWVKSTMNFIEGHNPPDSLKITDLAPTKNN